MKNLFVLACGLLLTGNVFAGTYCGKFSVNYLDKSEGGPGVTYSLDVPTYIDKAEGGIGASISTYTLDTSSTVSIVQSLRTSLVGLLEDQKNYCFEGNVSGLSLEFTAVKKD